MDSIRQVPIAALRFEASAPVAFAPDAAADQRRQFDGVAYSGDVIRNHYYWGNVVFDLASTTAPARLPILIEHDRAQRAGFGALAIGNEIRISGTLLDNPSGNAIAAEADAGFPWEMSVHIEPGSIEEVGAGTEVTVNGRALTGPLTVFRNSRIRETSFTPTGADPNTSARVFNTADTLEIPVSTASREEPSMSDAPDTAQRLAALESDLAAAQAATAAANQRADAAEAALSAMQASARLDAVKALFTAIGREFSDEAATPFVGMTDAQFAATATALRDTAARVPEGLFHEQATAGANPATTSLDFSSIYDARKRKGE